MGSTPTFGIFFESDPLSIKNTALVFLFLAINAAFLYFNSFRTMLFYDMGFILDASWRVYCGQVPCRDFLVSFGPIHFYLMAIFYHLFGFGKIALWAHTVTISSLVILATYILARHTSRLWVAALCAALSMVSFYWATSFPWYNQSAHFWGILGVAILGCWIISGAGGKSAGWTGSMLGLLAFTSFMTKTSIGPFYAIVFFLTLCVLPHKIRSLMSFVLGAFVAICVVRMFFISSYYDFIDQAILNYGRIQSHRLTDFAVHPRSFLLNHYWIIALIVSVGLWGFFRASLPLLILFFGIWITATTAFCTSGAVFQAEAEPLGIFVALGFVMLYQKLRLRPNDRVTKAVVCGLACITGYLIFVHARYGINVESWSISDSKTFINQKKPLGEYSLQAKSLKGWRTEPAKGQSLDRLVDFIETKIPREDSILVLTDMQMLNPMTGRQSYRGIPWHFVLDTLPAPGEQLARVRDQIESHRPDWIVTHKAKVPYISSLIDYLGLWQAIRSNYGIAYDDNLYLVLRKQKA